LIDLVNAYASNPIKASELLEVTMGEEATILEQVKSDYIDSIVDAVDQLVSGA